MATMDKCYKTLPLNDTTPTNLIEVNFISIFYYLLFTLKKIPSSVQSSNKSYHIFHVRKSTTLKLPKCANGFAGSFMETNAPGFFTTKNPGNASSSMVVPWTLITIVDNMGILLNQISPIVLT